MGGGQNGEKPYERIDVTDNFESAFLYTIGNEGGYSDITQDKGGPTNWGITISDLGRWRKHAVTKEDVKNLTQDEAKQIYFDWYWKPLNLDAIKEKNVAVALFDRSLLNGLTGVSRHVKSVLQVPQDELDNFDAWITRINACDTRWFITCLAGFCLLAHLERIDTDSSQKRFEDGWTNRVKRQLRELA